jgi:hypothetical protein
MRNVWWMKKALRGGCSGRRLWKTGENSYLAHVGGALGADQLPRRGRDGRTDGRTVVVWLQKVGWGGDGGRAMTERMPLWEMVAGGRWKSWWRWQPERVPPMGAKGEPSAAQQTMLMAAGCKVSSPASRGGAQTRFESTTGRGGTRRGVTSGAAGWERHKRRHSRPAANPDTSAQRYAHPSDETSPWGMQEQRRRVARGDTSAAVPAAGASTRRRRLTPRPPTAARS